MATSAALREQYPADEADGELAPVIDLVPSPDERGLSYHDLWQPSRVMRSLGQLAGRARDLAWDRLLADDDGLERVTFNYRGHEHLLLVSDPDPSIGIRPEHAPKIWLKPGLTELADIGSPIGLHKAIAERNPGSQVMTHATKGMSHGGSVVPRSEAGARWIDMHAAEDLAVLTEFTGGQPTEIDGTSWGSFSAVHMAAQNLRAKNGRQADIRKLHLISSAVIACEVDPEEDFREPELNEAAFRADLTDQFGKHVLAETLGLLKRPRELVTAWKVVPAYLMYPERVLSRLKVIGADFRSVQQGFGWRTLRMVANELDEINFVLGENDPLTVPQKPQIRALGEHSSRGNVRLTLIKGAGHFATTNAKQVADAIYGQPSELAQAA